MSAHRQTSATTMTATACAVVALAIGCNREPSHIDAGPRDMYVPTDVRTSCTDYPDLGFRLCPSYQPYCCRLGEYQFCSADSQGGACMEHPIGGIRQLCDRTNGMGCPSDHSICCGIDGITFCTDHALVGRWQCSP